MAQINAPLSYEESLEQAKRFVASLRDTLHMQGAIYPRRKESRIEILAAVPNGPVLHATYFPGGRATEWLRTKSLKAARKLIEV